MMSTRLAVLAAILGLAASPCLAVSYTTWRYSGTINYVFRNDIGLPDPIGLPLSVDITFDPTTPNSQTLPSPGCGCGPGIGDYLFSGGATNFQVKLGSHTADPIPQYRMTVIPAFFYASDDQFNFLSYQSQGMLMPLNIPGYLTNANVQLFFRQRHHPGPIVSPEMPTSPPNPFDFRDVRFVISKRVGNNLVLSAQSWMIPEPSALILAAFANRRPGHPPRRQFPLSYGETLAEGPLLSR
jgi:hypothetical protein